MYDLAWDICLDEFSLKLQHVHAAGKKQTVENFADFY